MVPCLNIHTMLIFKRIICNSSILKYLKTTKPIQHISLSSNSHLLPTILKPRGFLHRFRSITFGCLSMASDALYPLTSVETSNNQETLFIDLILISIELTTVCYFDKRLMPVTKLTQCFPHIDFSWFMTILRFVFHLREWHYPPAIGKFKLLTETFPPMYYIQCVLCQSNLYNIQSMLSQFNLYYIQSILSQLNLHYMQSMIVTPTLA